VQEQKELSPGVHPKPGHPSGLPVQSVVPVLQHGVRSPPENELWHWGAWLASGPQATTSTNVQVPSVQTFSTCHELLHTPTQ
jgi:hypothetical protein